MIVRFKVKNFRSLRDEVYLDFRATEFDPPLSVSNAADIGMRLFGEDGLKDVLAEMNGDVFLTSFYLNED